MQSGSHKVSHFALITSLVALAGSVTAIGIAVTFGNPGEHSFAQGLEAAAGFVVEQSGGSTVVAEGGATDTFAVRLATKPTKSVRVLMQANGQLSTSPAEVTFNGDNWGSARVITVTATNDATFEGTQSSSVGMYAISDQAAYNGKEKTVVVTIEDNDVAPADVPSAEPTDETNNDATTQVPEAAPENNANNTTNNQQQTATGETSQPAANQEEGKATQQVAEAETGGNGGGSGGGQGSQETAKAEQSRVVLEESVLPASVDTKKVDAVTDITFVRVGEGVLVTLTGTKDGKSVVQSGNADPSNFGLVVRAKDNKVVTETVSDLGPITLTHTGPSSQIAYEATVEGDLAFDTERGVFTVTVSDGSAIELTQQPADVASRILTTDQSADEVDSQMQLQAKDNALVYTVKAKDRVRLLGIFAFNAQLIFSVSASSESSSVQSPWYLNSRFIRAFVTHENLQL
jgi:tRNA threonylcarbamoyladenosine modification (KEOPS) complex  Pcc1 subunit